VSNDKRLAREQADPLGDQSAQLADPQPTLTKALDDLRWGNI
jgi:hypothetical protein